jgi:CBS domain-containing protein
MKNVSDILRAKRNAQTHCVHPGTTVLDALKLMADKGIGALVVVEDSRLTGVFSERDYARKIALMERSSRTTTVGEVMTANPICVTPAESTDFCMALMTDKHIRHLPVLDGDRLVGMISIGDLVKNIIEDQQAKIQQLENYVRGESY